MRKIDRICVRNFVQFIFLDGGSEDSTSEPHPQRCLQKTQKLPLQWQKTWRFLLSDTKVSISVFGRR